MKHSEYIQIPSLDTGEKADINYDQPFSDATIEGYNKEKSRTRKSCYIASCHLIIFVLYSILIFATLVQYKTTVLKAAYYPQNLYCKHTIMPLLTKVTDVYTAPAKKAVKVERTVWDDAFSSQNEFQGNPTRSLDDAWANLLHGYNIRVSAEELARTDQKSVELVDGPGGYLANLDVMHQLHCLVTLPALYQDNNKTADHRIPFLEVDPTLYTEGILPR